MTSHIFVLGKGVIHIDGLKRYSKKCFCTKQIPLQDKSKLKTRECKWSEVDYYEVIKFSQGDDEISHKALWGLWIRLPPTVFDHLTILSDWLIIP